MPTARRIGWAELKVGLMAIVAMIILAVLIFMLTSRESIFAKRATIYTYLSDSAALTQGAPVRLNGYLIGSVSDVQLSGLRDPERRIRIVMSVEQEHLKNIPIDSVAAISAENVLGTKYINIRMGQSSETIRPGGTLAALDTREFEELVQKGYTVVDSLQAILDRVEKVVAMVESGKGTIGKFLVDEEFYNRLTATVTELQKVTSAISSGRGTVGRLLYDETLYEQVIGTVQRLDSVVRDLQQGRPVRRREDHDCAAPEGARGSERRARDGRKAPEG
jgi:phospholipid/cholesterol/gamma-HCH transport system substrate-binding protein